MLDKLGDAPFIVKLLTLARAFIEELDAHAAVEKRQFLQPFVQQIVVELGRLEDHGVGLERGLRADFLGRPDSLHGSQRNAAFVLLLVDVPVAGHFDFAPLRQEIHDRHAHTVQSAGRLVGTFLEFSAELQDRHHAFERGDFSPQFLRQLFVRFDGDASAIVLHRHRTIGVDNHFDVFGKSGHGLINRIVDDLIHQVVQTTRRDVADIHGRPLADMIHVRQMLQVLRPIVGFGGLGAVFLAVCPAADRPVFRHS